MKWLQLALYVCGLGAVVTGCFLIYRPAGWIVGGLLLFGMSMLINREIEKR